MFDLIATYMTYMRLISVLHYKRPPKRFKSKLGSYLFSDALWIFRLHGFAAKGLWN